MAAIRILDYVLAPDGGTEIISLETDDGQRIDIGLDGRMDAPGAGRQLFIGASFGGPGSELLPIGSRRDREITALLRRWLDETQGFIRREMLLEADATALEGQSLLDRLGIEFVLSVIERELE